MVLLLLLLRKSRPLESPVLIAGWCERVWWKWLDWRRRDVAPFGRGRRGLLLPVLMLVLIGSLLLLFGTPLPVSLASLRCVVGGGWGGLVLLERE